MSENEGNGLLRVAEAISDGRPVDWDSESAAQPELSPILTELKLVEAALAVHRTEGSPSSDAMPASLAGAAQASTARPPAAEQVAIGNWGPLRLLEKIGQGGFGEVFRAFDPKLEREVALKLRRADRAVSGAQTRRYLEEARRLARVRQRNVLIVHGADEHDGRVGLWTDLVTGMTLEQLLLTLGPLDAEEAAVIGVNLCRALAAVHECGLVHRDVKTTNVMREHGGRIVLMDFGAVREASAASLAAGEEAGTPIVMAPERVRGEAVGPAADIYGLGVLLYRLVTGRYPILAASLPEMVAKLERGEITHLHDVRPDLPAGFTRVVERSLEPDPTKRYASAGAMERSLAHALGSLTPSEVVRASALSLPMTPTPAPAPGPEGASVQRGWRLAALLAGFALVALILVLLRLARR